MTYPILRHKSLLAFWRVWVFLVDMGTFVSDSPAFSAQHEDYQHQIESNVEAASCNHERVIGVEFVAHTNGYNLEQQVQGPEHLVAVPGFGQAAFVLEYHQCCAQEPGKGLNTVEQAEVVVIALVDPRFEGV